MVAIATEMQREKRTMDNEIPSRLPFEEAEERYQKRSSTRDSARRSFEMHDYVGANDRRDIDARLKRLNLHHKVKDALAAESFQLPARERNESFKATIENVILERILAKNDLMPIAFLRQGQMRSKTIGRIVIRHPSGNLAGYGTGFMVSPTLALTNNHVLRTAPDASRSKIEFDYELDAHDNPREKTEFQIDPDTFFITNKELDFTLVAVKPNDNVKPEDWGWNKLPEESDGLVVKGENVSIIQHPNGEMKQIALRENQVLDLLDDFTHYKTDTAPGSSGSPVFNDQWEVVALHHSGVPRRDNKDRILTVDGRIWEPWMGDHRIDWIANEGVAIHRIVEYLKSSQLNASQRRLRDAMFNSVPPASPNVDTQDRAPNDGGSSPSSPVDFGPLVHNGGSEQQQISINTSLPQNNSGGATWTVPLHISVSVGNPTGSSDSGSDSTDSDTQQALSDLDAAEDREYYDERQDERDKEAYYASINAARLSADEFYDELNELLKRTHSPKPSYKPSRHVYPWVDLHPDRKLRSIYSGKSFDPREVILMDQEIARARDRGMRELAARESLSHEAFQEAVDLLESQHPFNCEHVVPQSWYAKKEPARGDLHHLFTCETRCNSFRSNLAYYDFPDFEEATRPECGKREGNRFEPSAGKGAVARATLYFLLRYKGLIESPSEMHEDRLAFLLQWHLDHPVSRYELHRNQAIFEKQGNRNPLIDFPEWASKINFAQGIG